VYKYFCVSENKSVFNWTFCQRLSEKPNREKARMFVTDKHIPPSLLFLSKARAYPDGAPTFVKSSSSLKKVRLTFPQVTNTVAYCNEASMKQYALKIVNRLTIV
jgi:hypothetical protein